MEPAVRNLEGLRGWLVLVGAGAILAFPLYGFAAYESAVAFANGSVGLLSDPTGQSYVAGFGGLARFELIGAGLLAIMAVYLSCLFFMRSPFFPTAYISMLIATVVYVLVEFLWIEQLIAHESVVRDYLKSAAAEIQANVPRTVLSAALWTTYMVRSRRVKATFFQTVPAAAVSEGVPAPEGRTALITRRSAYPVLYIFAAFFLGAISATVAGEDFASAERSGRWLGAACAGPMLGAIVGGIRRLFGKTSVAKWVFWFSVVALIGSLISRK